MDRSAGTAIGATRQPVRPRWLTEHQQELLRMLARDMTPGEIAAVNGSGARTVYNQLHALQRRFGVKTYSALVVAAVRRGLVDVATSAGTDGPVLLTDEQVELLTLLAHGWRSCEIAERMYISREYVCYKLTILKHVLGVRTKHGLIAAALRLGVVGLPGERLGSSGFTAVL